jgi:hypothetical protein
MAAYLHAEGRMAGANPGFPRNYSDPLGDIVGVLYGCWGPTAKLIYETVVGDSLGDYPSVGIANLRANVVLEILQNQIPGVETSNFEYQGDLREEYEHIMQYGTDFLGYPVVESTERTSFNVSLEQWIAIGLRDPDTSLDLLAANFQRGIIRATNLGLQPSVFNLLSWARGGIQSYDELDRNSSGGTSYANAHLAKIDVAFDVLGLHGAFHRYNLDVDYHFLSDENKLLPQCGYH